jgi:hypothetical protein
MVAVFTVYFEDPFWVGVLESEEGGTLSVARHVFGAEPSNPELLRFMLHRFAHLPRSASRSGGGDEPCGAAAGGARSPKRALREASREQSRPVSTKAQAALSAARSELKVERAVSSRAERLAEEERRFELRSEKRKRKRAGH